MVKIGTRVSGEIGGQKFTGLVVTTFGRGGHMASDGSYIVEPVAECVIVATEEPLQMPSGRLVYRAKVKGADEIEKLIVIEPSHI